MKRRVGLVVVSNSSRIRGNMNCMGDEEGLRRGGR